jgi:hypothetical protein
MSFIPFPGIGLISISRTPGLAGNITNATIADTLYFYVRITNQGCATASDFHVSITEGADRINLPVDDVGGGGFTQNGAVFPDAAAGSHTIQFTLIDPNSRPIQTEERTFYVASPPEISQEPLNVTVTEGDGIPAAFSVIANGAPSPAYQWQFEGKNIPNATSATYSIKTPAFANQGNYSVVVSNYAGFQKSENAVLRVNAAPSKLQQFSLTVDGKFEGNIVGQPGRPLTVEKSTDMQQWTALTNITGSAKFTDPNPATNPFAVYRVKAN